MSTFEILSLVINFIGIGLIIFQLAIAVRSFKAEHERKKKQATIEYIHNAREVYNKSRRNVEAMFGTDVLTEANVIELVKDSRAKDEIKDLLAILEYISVGMNTGVFDKDLWYRMSGAFLIRVYNQARSYIKYSQKDHPTAYIEFEEIVKDFEERNRKKVASTKGNIKYS